MNPDTARLVFVSIMAAGFIVWLWSLIMASRLGRSASDADRLTFDEGPALRTETGEVTVSGDSESLSKALVRALRQPGIGMLFFRLSLRPGRPLSPMPTSFGL